MMRWLEKVFGQKVPRSERLINLVLLSVIGLACVHRVWLVFEYNPIDAIWSDPGRHWTLATRPLDTQPFAAIDPVGYHVYLGAIAKVTSGAGVLVAYWTALLSIAGPWLWYRFFRHLLPTRQWALAGWALLAALPSWSGIYSYFMQETLLLPMLGAALWATWRCRRKQDVSSFALAVVAWILTGLTRGICIPLAAVAMTWLWLSQAQKVPKAAVSLILLLGVLGPLAGRSWYLIRQISPHGLATMNQLYAQAGTESFSIDFYRRNGSEHWRYIFQSPSMGAAPLEPFSDWRSHRLGHVSFSIDLDHGSRDWIAAKESLPPWTISRYVWLTSDNLVNLFFTHSWPDSNRERVIGSVNYWMRWIWLPLALICIGWGIALRHKQPERLLPALLLTWFLFQGLVPLTVNEGRYRKPFEGLIIAQCLLIASTRDRRTRRPAGSRLVASAEQPVPTQAGASREELSSVASLGPVQ